jgi:hypothetical protein
MDGMVFRRAVRLASILCFAALLAPACHRAVARPEHPAQLEDFHYSDPKTIAATGRPQLLEFVGPT